MRKSDIVVVGGSAGSIEALLELLDLLPTDLQAAFFVAIHLKPGYVSQLPKVLTRSGVLRERAPSDAELIEPGCLYVAPPDRHLVLEGRSVRVTAGPRVRGQRPAIDVLFRSAAEAHGPRVIGVLLSGLLSDGVAGLAAIQEHGGAALVQDPADAAFGDLPRNALAALEPDAVADTAGLAREIAARTRRVGRRS